MVADFQRLVEVLARERVRYVIIGGVALVLHGSARATQALDLCYARDDANLEALARALAETHPTLRGAPADLPFQLDARTLRMGLNFALSTDLGDVDLLGEIAGVGGYAAMVTDAIPFEIYGQSVQVMSLDRLEVAKKAAGRLKDLADLDEIRAIRARRIE